MSRCMSLFLSWASEKEFHILKGVLTLEIPSNGIVWFSLQGYFLLFESMLDTVLFARDKWLKSAGCGKTFLRFELISFAAGIIESMYVYWLLSATHVFTKLQRERKFDWFKCLLWMRINSYKEHEQRVHILQYAYETWIGDFLKAPKLETYYIFFVNSNKNLALSLTSQRSCRYEIRFQISPQIDVVAPFCNSIQQPGRVFATSFRPRPFVQMASAKPFLTTTLGCGCS